MVCTLYHWDLCRLYSMHLEIGRSTHDRILLCSTTFWGMESWKTPPINTTHWVMSPTRVLGPMLPLTSPAHLFFSFSIQYYHLLPPFWCMCQTHYLHSVCLLSVPFWMPESWEDSAYLDKQDGCILAWDKKQLKREMLTREVSWQRSARSHCSCGVYLIYLKFCVYCAQ